MFFSLCVAKCWSLFKRKRGRVENNVTELFWAKVSSGLQCLRCNVAKTED